MLNKEERQKIKKKMTELSQLLAEDNKEKFFIAARKTEESYLGRCYKHGKEYYRIISVLTPECPYQLWAIRFDISAEISPLPVKKLLIDSNERYAFGDFDEIGIEIVKIPNNMQGNPNSMFDEISQGEFMEAYEFMCKKLKEDMLKTFPVKKVGA